MMCKALVVFSEKNLTLLKMFRNIRSSMESMTLCAKVFRNQSSMGLHLPVFIKP